MAQRQRSMEARRDARLAAAASSSTRGQSAAAVGRDVPDFDRLHRQFELGMLERQAGVRVTRPEPFRLLTQQRAKVAQEHTKKCLASDQDPKANRTLYDFSLRYPTDPADEAESSEAAATEAAAERERQRQAELKRVNPEGAYQEKLRELDRKMKERDLLIAEQSKLIAQQNACARYRQSLLQAGVEPARIAALVRAYRERELATFGGAGGDDERSEYFNDGFSSARQSATKFSSNGATDSMGCLGCESFRLQFRSRLPLVDNRLQENDGAQQICNVMRNHCACLAVLGAAHQLRGVLVDPLTAPPLLPGQQPFAFDAAAGDAGAIPAEQPVPGGEERLVVGQRLHVVHVVLRAAAVLSGPAERGVVLMMDGVEVLVQPAVPMVHHVPEPILEVEDHHHGDALVGEVVELRGKPGERRRRHPDPLGDHGGHDEHEIVVQCLQNRFAHHRPGHPFFWLNLESFHDFEVLEVQVHDGVGDVAQEVESHGQKDGEQWRGHPVLKAEP
uniref:CCDC50_N domain-containing protein n=1 Tax=Macrostomum lignano TaxID=282301 RepID=A0A1I8I7I4_9PLAT